MKPLTFLIFCLFLISFVSAQDCQYKTNETYKEFGTYLFDSDDKYYGEPLILKDFIGSYYNIAGCQGNPSFMVKNPYAFEISINLSAIMFKPATAGNAFPEAKQEVKLSMTIPQYEEKKVEGNCIGIGSNYFLNDSVSYIFINPEGITLKKGYRDLKREICKICPNGKRCLDNGTSCTLDNECGSGTCNPDYKCGIFLGCSQGKMLCNNTNKCVMASFIEDGQPYSCSEECASGMIPCNGICRKVSAKNIGEEYHCLEECKSGVGKEGVCKRNIGDWFILIFDLFIILILALTIRLISKSVYEYLKRKRIEKEIEKIHKEGDMLNEKELERKRLKKLKELTKKDKEELKKINSDIQNLTISIEDKKIYISKLDKDYTKPHPSSILKGCWEWYNPNIRNKYYPCYVYRDSSGDYTKTTDKEIHKDVAKQKIFDKYPNFFKKYYPDLDFKDLIVHHINKDYHNYKENNLIIISYIQHEGLHDHIYGDRNKALDILRKKGIKQPHLKELN